MVPLYFTRSLCNSKYKNLGIDFQSNGAWDAHVNRIVVESESVSSVISM